MFVVTAELEVNERAAGCVRACLRICWMSGQMQSREEEKDKKKKKKIRRRRR